MKALNVVEKATIKGHLIRALKEQTAQHRLQNLPLRTLSPGSNRMLTSPITRLISFNVWNRPLDEYVLAEFKTFINPFFPMLLYFKAQPSVSWENECLQTDFWMAKPNPQIWHALKRTYTGSGLKTLTGDSFLTPPFAQQINTIILAPSPKINNKKRQIFYLLSDTQR